MGDGKNSDRRAPRVAALVPCFNEAAAIDKVVRDFRGSLPGGPVLSISSGLVLDTVARGRPETKLLAHLVRPAVEERLGVKPVRVAMDRMRARC